MEVEAIDLVEEHRHLAGCGEFCGSCAYHTGEKQPPCPSCEEHRGHPFWGECRTYSCITAHGVGHCGVCEEFPCENFINQYDPGNPEGQRDAVFRAGLLAYRARHGDANTLKLLRKL